MSTRICLSSPHMGNEEKKYIDQTLASNWIAPVGPNIDQFEASISQLVGVPHVLAVSSGTAAIHLALILLNVQEGDTVFCQSFTFAASANPVTYLGAKPVFIDSEPDTWNMDPVLLKTALKEADSKNALPKAIIVVHSFGMPAKMAELTSIAATYGVPILEDAAEAIGSKIEDRYCGSFGSYSVFSFNGNKIITTSGGGTLLSNNGIAIQRARFLATQAKDAAPHYQHSQIGYNYGLSNLLAGIGLGQLEVLEDRIKARRFNFERYNAVFDKYNAMGYHFKFQEEPRGHYSNRWLTCMLIDPAKNLGLTSHAIRLAFEKENIETRPLWKPLHQQPVFENCIKYTNGVSDLLFEQGICLPSGSNLTNESFDRIINCFDALLEKNAQWGTVAI